jgi:uncharacterized protein YecT (DUF1311 family)
VSGRVEHAVDRRALAACAFAVALAPPAAIAGALDECMPRGDHAAVTRCLQGVDAEVRGALDRAEAAADSRARELDTVTGRPGAAAALAKSVRTFGEYRKAQCDFVQASYASGAGATQAGLACRIDHNRARVRELRP